MKTSWTLDSLVTLETLDCCNCGVTFAMPARLLRKFREEGGTFYCPTGHAQLFATSEVEKLKKQLAEEKKKLAAEKKYNEEAWAYADQVRDERDQAKASLRATRAAHTRTKKRLAGGVCPCCNRHFPQLRAHMTDKHPDYAHTDDVVDGGEG